jgi:hypothetical protein
VKLEQSWDTSLVNPLINSLLGQYTKWTCFWVRIHMVCMILVSPCRARSFWGWSSNPTPTTDTWNKFLVGTYSYTSVWHKWIVQLLYEYPLSVQCTLCILAHNIKHLQGVTKNGVPATTSIPFLCKLCKELSNCTRKISTGLSILLMLYDG